MNTYFLLVILIKTFVRGRRFNQLVANSSISSKVFLSSLLYPIGMNTCHLHALDALMLGYLAQKRLLPTTPDGSLYF
jgi:hypothetical protein